MIYPVKIVSDEEKRYIYDIERKTERGILKGAYIADLHFGVNSVSPKIEYEILKNQFIDKIKGLGLNIIGILGDLLDRKFMSNTDAVLYLTKLIGDIVKICKDEKITLIIIKGTDGHEAGQLRLFYHYLSDNDIDIRIVENIKFEYVNGIKILCIPELYGLEESIYYKYLFGNGLYDMCLMHGTINGAVRGNKVGNGRLFTMDDFLLCKGPIVSGHIHPGGCYHTHFYYTGSPIRYEFGEENTKGFYILLYDLDSFKYYIHLEPIESFKYTTINIDEILSSDPKDIIEYINILKEKNNIDYLRIEINKNISRDNLELIRTYYRNNNTIKFKIDQLKKIEENNETSNREIIEKYDYLLDINNKPEDNLARFMNDDLGYIYISGDDIRKLMEDEI